MSQWQVQEAKARFSEMMRGADEAGPQTITVRGRGRPCSKDYDRLSGRKPSLAKFMRPLAGIDLAIDRDRSPVHNVEL